jgi:signal transduction histidine kinase
MSYHWIIPLIASLATVGLGLFVLRAAPRTELRKVFVFGAITLSFWNLIYVVFYSVKDRDLAFELLRPIRSGAMFLFPAVLHLSMSLPGRPRHPILRWILMVDYALFGLLVVANSFDLVVKDLRVVQWGYYSVGTPLYGIFIVLVIANFVGALGMLVYEYRTTADARMRLQLKFWLFGMAIALPLGLTNMLPAYGVPIYPLGNLGSAAWAGIIAYGIARHRLMDIEVAVTKGIAYVGGLVILIIPAFLLTVAMQRLAFGDIHYDLSAGVLTLLLAIAVLFPIVRSRTEARVERSLFPQKQASRQALATFARSVIRILDRERLTRECTDKLHEVFATERVACLLADEGQRRLELRCATGALPPHSRIACDNSLGRWLANHSDSVLRDELVEGRLGNVPSQLIDICQRNEWEVIVPLATGSTLVGLIGLGPRRDLQAFTAGDLELLNNVAAQASIAFENARLYEELRKSKDIINRAGRLSALGTLAAGIAHEIRNPLVSIQTFFQLAPARIGDEEFMSSFLGLAEGEVQRISNLISELLSFAKSPAPATSEVEVDDVVERTVTLLAPQAKTQRVELLRTEVLDMPPILADRDQIRQVLINVVLNAIQATNEGGSVSISARLKEREGKSYCRLEVSDTGPGIPTDIREEIFNPFFTTKDKGTGLGLPIAHQIVTEAGGFISVESVEGSGTTFFIDLPIVTDLSDTGPLLRPVRTAGG